MTGPDGRPSLSGQAAQSQYFGLDGIDNNNYQGNFQSGNAWSLSPSPDAIQEFKVQTNNFSAEFGQSAGGVVNVITKSGTNDFHGTLFEFVRNQEFDARNFFAQSKPPYKQNQFGGSLGGPVRLPHFNGRNKLFFFGDWKASAHAKGSPRTASCRMRRNDRAISENCDRTNIPIHAWARFTIRASSLTPPPLAK